MINTKLDINMQKEKCLQFKDGPTPCFRDVDMTVCSLNFCPAGKYLKQFPNLKPFQVLHSHCVMSDSYGQQNDFDEGKGIFIATLARIYAKKRKK